MKLKVLKKTLVITMVILLFITSAGYAQDIIVKKNGEEIEAVINEVNLHIIRYKRFDNLEGPVYEIAKSDIFMIKYQNGTKEVINSLEENRAKNNSEENISSLKTGVNKISDDIEVVVSDLKEQYDQRTEAVNRDDLAFTRAHKSFSLLYGLSSFLGLGSMFASGPDFDFNSYAIGPLTFRFNRAVSENVSINYGPSFLYYKQNIRVSGYRTDTHLLFGAFELGINYHFTSTTKIDPYIGIGSGVGYFYTISDDYEGPLSGTIPVLYSAKVGMNTINKSNHAWTFELAYDYLAYFKVGYTFIKHR